MKSLLSGIKKFSLVLAVFSISALALIADGPPPPLSERIQQSELRQNQLRNSTRQVGGKLAALLGEFERNGIAGDEVVVLRMMTAVLNRLSEEEMARIVALLQEASAAPNPTASRMRLLEADAGQKAVVLKLKQLIDEFKRQQALYELALRFYQLAEKQHDNLKEAVWLEPLVKGKTPDSYGDACQIPWKQQLIQQENIQAETALALARLDELLKQVEGPQAERPQKARDLARSNNLPGILDAAIDDLKTGRIASAAGRERRARDLMRDIARQLTPPKDLADALRNALRDVEQAIAEQKTIVNLTDRITKESQDHKEVADRQLALSDKTESLREDVQNMAPSAASRLKEAVSQMQDAHGILNQGSAKYRTREARESETAALKSLEAAREELQKQIASVEKETPSRKDALAALQDLQNAVRELAAAQEQLKKESAENAAQKPQLSQTAAPRQKALKEKAQELQAEAAPVAESAAQELAQAANQMEKAQKNLEKGANPPETQQAALDALARAQDELGRKAAAMEKAAQQLNNNEQALNNLKNIMKEQGHLQLDTANAAAKPSAEKPQTAALAGKQQELADKTAGVNQMVAADTPEASKGLNAANENMRAAGQNLQQANAAAAQPKQAQALKNLASAKQALENRIAQLQKELGRSPDNSSSLAAAAAQIEQAQTEVAKAVQQLTPGGFQNSAQQPGSNQSSGKGQSPAQNAGKPQNGAGNAASQQSGSQPGQQAGSGNQPSGAVPAPAIAQAAQHLQKAAGHASEAAASSGLPSAAQAALQQAQNALSEATGQAAAQNASSARQNADAAQGALSQAAAALAMAQAGMSSSPGAASAQADGQGESQTQGDGQGQGSGQTQGQGQGQGQAQGKGQGQNQGMGQGQAMQKGGYGGPRGTGTGGNWYGGGGDKGPRDEHKGSSTFIGLPKRDRAALLQSQSEKYPAEYGPLVEQYMKNLADETSAPKK